MNVILRTRNRLLLSLSPDALACIRQVLADATLNASAKTYLEELERALETHPLDDDQDLVEAWADGGSVQVRAISSFGDPIDMGITEARAFADKVHACTRSRIHSPDD